MKTKSISKIISVLFALVMTTCLTSCEDERSIPVQGSSLESESGVRHQIVTKSKSEQLPSEASQGADFMLVNAIIERGSDDAEYLIIYTGVTNLTNEPLSALNLLGVTAWYPNDTDDWFSGAALSYANTDIGDFKVDDYDRLIKPGEQSLVLYAFNLAPDDFAYITIKAYDIKTEEMIFETNIDMMTED